MAQQNWTPPENQLNIGYVRRLWLAPSFQASAARLSASQLEATHLYQLHLNAEVFGLVFQSGDCKVTLSETPDVNGTIYAITIEFDLPGQATEFRAWLRPLVNARWIVGYEDYNQTAWLAGQPKNGLQLSIARIAATKNSLRCTLTGRQTRPFPTLTNYPGYRFGAVDFDSDDFLLTHFFA